MGGYSGKAVASHTPIVKIGDQPLAVSAAQYKLIARAIKCSGFLYVKGAEVRTARALRLFGELEGEGSLSGDGTGNPDGERWRFRLKEGVTIPGVEARLAPAAPRREDLFARAMDALRRSPWGGRPDVLLDFAPHELPGGLAQLLEEVRRALPDTAAAGAVEALGALWCSAPWVRVEADPEPLREDQIFVARAHFDLLRAINDGAGHGLNTTPGVQPLRDAGLVTIDLDIAVMTPVGKLALAAVRKDCVGTPLDHRRRHEPPAPPRTT